MRTNSCWGYTMYKEWAAYRQEKQPESQYGPVPVTLEAANYQLMDYWITCFILEAQRKDGKPYPPQTIYNIVCAIQVKLYSLLPYDIDILMWFPFQIC